MNISLYNSIQPRIYLENLFKKFFSVSVKGNMWFMCTIANKDAKDYTMIRKYLQGEVCRDDNDRLDNWFDEIFSTKERSVGINNSMVLTSGKNAEDTCWSIRKSTEFKQAKKNRLESSVNSRMYLFNFPVGQMTNSDLPNGSTLMLNSKAKIQSSRGFINSEFNERC